MLIPYKHPTHDLQGRYELDSSRATFWFSHPNVDTEQDSEWKRREQLVTEELPALVLSDPMLLVKTDLSNMMGADKDTDLRKIAEIDPDSSKAIAVISGELVLPKPPSLNYIGDEAPFVLAETSSNGTKIVPIESSLRLYAAENLLRRCATSISTIFELPLRVI